MPEIFSLAGKKVWVAGHTGLVGSALVRALDKSNVEILTVSSSQLDLRRQSSVESWMGRTKPDVILLAAARVGGIGANAAYPADFIYDNLAIAQNVIHQAYVQKVSKLIFLGSSCIYPKEAAQPIRPEALLSGPLESTNEAYAIAKIAGIKLCQFYRQQHGCDFVSVMPCNLYGPGDCWDERTSHVIPALIGRFHRALMKKADIVTVWGTGRPLREFMYVDDLAAAVLCVLKNYTGSMPVNLGSGQEISIANLAAEIARTVGFQGNIEFNSAFPDGTMRKIMDTSCLRQLGWTQKFSLQDGLKLAYEDFLAELSSPVRMSARN